MFIAAGLLLAGGLAFGVWQHSRAQAEVKATAEQRRDLVLNVRVVPVRANDVMVTAKLPGSTEAFEPTFMPGPAATSPSAMSTSAITSRPARFSPR